MLSLPISLQGIAAEFGAPLVTPLGSFIRGGAYVPIDAPGAQNVATALPVNITSFNGARHKAALYLSASSILSSNGLTLTSAVQNSDCSLVTVILGANVNNANSPAQASGTFQLTLGVSFVDSLQGLTIEMPPGQPTVNNISYTYGNYSLLDTVTPAGGLLPNLALRAPFPPREIDATDPFTGLLQIDKAEQLGVQPNNPAFLVSLASPTTFNLTFPVLHSIQAGVGASGSKQWRTFNVTRSFIEFPIRFKVYDLEGLNFTLDSIIRIEIDSTIRFSNP